MDALLGEVHASGSDAAVAYQPLLELGDASGAADIRNGEIALDQSVGAHCTSFR